MDRLEQVEYKLNYLLSQYEERKTEPGFKLQLAFLTAERNRLLGKTKPLEDVD